MKRIIICIFSVAACICLAVTALNIIYYKDVFPFGIWINGNYCTGMNVTRVSEMLNEQYQYKTVCIKLSDNESYELTLNEEYGVYIDYLPAVEELFYENHGWNWISHGNIFHGYQKYEIEPIYNYDKQKMSVKLSELEWLNQNLYHPDNTISIIKSVNDGYILLDETKHLLVKDHAVDFIIQGIVNELTEITLDESCYKDVPHTDIMDDVLKKWQGIEEFQGFKLIYDFGEAQEIVDRRTVCDWIALDENGNIMFDEEDKPVLDETMIKEYVAYLASTYNTVGVERTFQTTRGDIVTVSGGSYGNELDIDTEYHYLFDAFTKKQGGTRIPVYLSEAKQKGTNDIGSTYIEIDMGNQMMYYYKKNKLILETPVVTGNTSKNMGTPAKVCYVYYKQKNRVLRGADYATPVKYWMAVDGHIGIHDASWRKEFGGEIYKKNGSHGCINTPLDKVAELYELVEIGTPVIMFY